MWNQQKNVETHFLDQWLKNFDCWHSTGEFEKKLLTLTTVDGGFGPGTKGAVETYKPSVERVRCYRMKHYYDLVNKKPVVIPQLNKLKNNAAGAT